jgi:ribosomal protein S18 acetylase RimI-like enzyme
VAAGSRWPLAFDPVPEPPSAPSVRPALPGDAEAVAWLLYLSAAGLYDRYAGGPERALRLLGRAFARPGTNASAEVVSVAEVDGRVAGAMAAFPVDEALARARRFLRVSAATLPPWRWPAALAIYRRGSSAAPIPPARSLYVDGLATDPRARRRGAARALLAAADRRAAVLGLASVALDTTLDNEPARTLYETAGFELAGRVQPARGLPGFVGYVKPVTRAGPG